MFHPLCKYIRLLNFLLVHVHAMLVPGKWLESDKYLQVSSGPGKQSSTEKPRKSIILTSSRNFLKHNPNSTDLLPLSSRIKQQKHSRTVNTG